MIRVGKQEVDVALEFQNAKDLFEWVTSITEDIPSIREFLNGGFLTDEHNNRFFLRDLL